MKRLFLVVTLAFSFLSFSYAQWAPTSATGITTAIRTISVVDDNIVWAGADGGPVLRTTNGGTNWANVTGSPIGANGVFCIWGVDAQNALCTTSPSSGTFVYKTTNAGANWTQVFAQTGGFINAIWMTSATNGFMEGDPVQARWSLWKTTNGGTTWDSTGLYVPQVGSEAGWNNGIFIMGTNIWFNTSVAKIYYSANNGTSWSPQTIPSAASAFGQVWFNSPTLGLASANTTPLRTTNLGSNWTAGTVPPGTGNIAGIIGSGTTFWIVRNTATGIYKTTNNGVNWTTDYTATAPLWHIGLSRNGIAAYAAGGTGTVVKNSNLLIGITPIGGEVPNIYELGQNYPNPFNPQTSINISLPKSSFVTMKVFDVLGKEVLTPVNEFKTTGNYSVSIDGSSLSSGIYFYTLTAADFTATKKMILIK